MIKSLLLDVIRRELMMRDGEVEPIEGVVIISEKLAARENVKIISQVGLPATQCLSNMSKLIRIPPQLSHICIYY